MTISVIEGVFAVFQITWGNISDTLLWKKAVYSSKQFKLLKLKKLHGNKWIVSNLHLNKGIIGYFFLWHLKIFSNFSLPMLQLL